MELWALMNVAIPKISAGALQLFTSLLLARTLGPEEFGPLSVCITSIILLDGVFGSAIDLGVVRLTTSGHGPASSSGLALQKAGLVSKLVLVVLIGLPVMLFAVPLSEMVFHTSPALLWLTLASAFALMLLRSVQTFFQVSGRFFEYGIADGLHSLLKFGGIAILLAMHRATPTLTMICYSVGPLVVATAFLASRVRPVVSARLRVDAVARLGRTASWSVAAAAVGTITTRMDLFFVSTLAGPAEAGSFSAAQVLIVGFSLLGMYLGVAIAPRIMPLWESGELAATYARFQKWSLAGCAAIFLSAVALLEPISAWLLPPSFQQTSELALWLLPSSLVALLNFPWTVSLLLFSNAFFLFAFDAVLFPVLVVAYRESILRQGALGAAVVTSSYAILKTLVLQFVAWRALQHGRPADVRGVPSLAAVR